MYNYVHGDLVIIRSLILLSEVSYKVKIISTEDKGNLEKSVTSNTNSVIVNGLECGSSFVSFVTAFVLDTPGPDSSVLHFKISELNFYSRCAYLYVYMVLCNNIF